MSFSNFRPSQDFLLRSATVDESSFGDESSLGDSRDSFSIYDESDLQPSPSSQGAVDLVTNNRSNSELPNSLYARIKYSIRTCIRQKRISARLPLSLNSLKRWICRPVGGRPRFSKCVLYVIMGYLMILSVFPYLDNLSSSATLLTYSIAVSFTSSTASLRPSKRVFLTIWIGSLTTGAWLASQLKDLADGRPMPLLTFIRSTATPITITGDQSRSTQQFMLVVLARKLMSGSSMKNYTLAIVRPLWQKIVPFEICTSLRCWNL